MFIIMKEKQIINEIVVAYKLVMQKKIQNFLEYCVSLVWRKLMAWWID